MGPAILQYQYGRTRAKEYIHCNNLTRGTSCDNDNINYLFIVKIIRKLEQYPIYLKYWKFTQENRS